MQSQLSLDIKVDNYSTFDNYFVTKNNEQVVENLKDIILNNKPDQYLYLWGTQGSGKTHLLCACSDYADKIGYKVLYISLKEIINCENDMASGIFENMDMFNFVCIDDLDMISGNRYWQELLFDVYNQCIDKKIKLIIASNKAIGNMDISLSDLKSRLLWGVRYHLHELFDNEKILALRLHAKNRAMDLSDEVASYIIKRYSRNMNNLYQILDKLDKASWQKQRKLTVPFVKTVL